MVLHFRATGIRWALAGVSTFLYFTTTAQVEWYRTYSDYSFGSRERLYDLEVNADGETYLVGTAEEMGNDRALVLIKYDADLNELWKVEGQFSSLPEPERFLKLALNPTRDEVYVAGAYLRQEEGQFYLQPVLKKYDGSGAQQWNVLLPFEQAEPTDLVADSNGSVYISLSLRGANGEMETRLLCYDAEGRLRWQKNNPASFSEDGYVPRQLLLDEQKATGYLISSSFNRLHLLRFTLPDGEPDWELRPVFSSEEQTIFGEAVLRADGSICIGYASADEESPGDLDVRVFCASPQGDILWERSYDAGAKQADVLDALAADSLGLYLGAHTWSEDSQNDIWLLRLGADGRIDWQKRHDGHGYDDVPRDLTVGPTGTLYCSAFYETGSWYHDALLLTYARDGRLRWEQLDAGTPEAAHDFQHLALTEGGKRLVLAGFSEFFDRPEMAFYPFKSDLTVRGYQPETGSLTSSAGYSGRGVSQFESRWVKVGASGSIYQAGFRNLGFSLFNDGRFREIYDLVLLKYTPNGQLLWSRVFEAEKHNEQWPPFRFEFDSREASLLLIQETYEANRTRLVKYAADGSLEWDRYLSAPSSESFPLHLEVSPTDNSYVLYVVDGQMRLTNLSADGNILWTQTMESDYITCSGYNNYTIDFTATEGLLLSYNIGGCTTERVLVRLDGEGLPLWRITATGLTGPLIWQDRFIYTLDFPFLNRHDLDNGTLQWRREIPVDPVGLFGMVPWQERLVLVGGGKMVILDEEGRMVASETYRREPVWALFEEDHVIFIDNLFNNQVYDYDAEYRGEVECEGCYRFDFYPPYERYLGGSAVSGAVSADAHDGALYLGGQANYGPRGQPLFPGGGSEMILFKTNYQLLPVGRREIGAGGEAAILIFPNPSTGSLTIQAPAPFLTGMFRLFDLAGRLVWERPADDWKSGQTFQLNLPAGVFLLQIVTERGSFSERIVIAP